LPQLEADALARAVGEADAREPLRMVLNLNHVGAERERARGDLPGPVETDEGGLVTALEGIAGVESRATDGQRGHGVRLRLAQARAIPAMPTANASPPTRRGKAYLALRNAATWAPGAQRESRPASNFCSASVKPPRTLVRNDVARFSPNEL